MPRGREGWSGVKERKEGEEEKEWREFFIFCIYGVVKKRHFCYNDHHARGIQRERREAKERMREM